MTKPGNSGSLCVLPWIHLFADEAGLLYPCCFSHQKAISNEKGEPYRFAVPGEIEAGWNSEFMRKIRRTMIAGERPPECAACWRSEDLGSTSYRLDQNRAYSSVLSEIEAATEVDGSAPMDFRFIDIRLGNRCNLRCRMCSPLSSRLLVDEFAEIQGHSPEEPWLKAYRALDWYKEPGAWEKLEPYLSKLDRLHFAGGEPLIIKEGYEFLRRIIRAGYAKNIRITYNSNITIIPEEAKALWPEFKGVHVCASLDGIGAVNEYIRFPSKWSALEKNLEWLDTEGPKHNVTSVTVHATIQIYNVLKICDLFRYAFERFRFISPYIYMDMVMDRNYLDPLVLPAPLRQLAIDRIEEFKTWLAESGKAANSPNLAPFLGRVDSIKNYLLSGDRTATLPEFQRATAIYDRHRSQKLLDFVPELAPIYPA